MRRGANDPIDDSMTSYLWSILNPFLGLFYTTLTTHNPRVCNSADCAVAFLTICFVSLIVELSSMIRWTIARWTIGKTEKN
jgi:hypothetical protein